MKKIIELQEELKSLGYQWQEHIFNDGMPDCFLEISNSINPSVFSMHPETIPGWGRFNRLYCWTEAVKYAKERKK